MNINIQAEQPTLSQQIKALVAASQNYTDLNKVTRTEKLVHKDTGEVLPELSAIELRKKGIDVTQYNLETVTTNPRQDLVLALTGNNTNIITDSELKTLASLYELGKVLRTKTKSPYQLEMNALNAKKTKAKGNTTELTKVKTEIAQLMVERFNSSGTKPKSTTDKETVEIYEKLIAEQSN